MLLAVLLVALTACDSVELTQENIQDVIQANQELRTVTDQTKITMTLEAQGMRMPIELDSQGVVNYETQQAQGTMNVQAFFMQEKTEYYFEEGTLYVYQDGTWSQEETEEGFAEMDLNAATKLLEESSVNITREEKDDTNYYRVQAEVNQEYLLEILLGEMDAESVELLGKQEENPIREYSVSYLIHPRTLYIEEMSIQAHIVLTDEQTGDVNIEVETLGTYSQHNQPVNIQRPEGIEEANTQPSFAKSNTITGAAISQVRT